VVQGGPERSWSTRGGRGPRGQPGPLRSTLIHTFRNFTENVDQGGSGWTGRTRGTITPLGGPGVVFHFADAGSTSLEWEPDLTLNIRNLSTLVCATYCHVCLSHGECVVPVHLDGYMHMYPLLNRFTNNLHEFACQTIIRRYRRWPILILLAPFRLGLQEAFLHLNRCLPTLSY